MVHNAIFGNRNQIVAQIVIYRCKDDEAINFHFLIAVLKYMNGLHNNKNKYLFFLFICDSMIDLGIFPTHQLLTAI